MRLFFADIFPFQNLDPLYFDSLYKNPNAIDFMEKHFPYNMKFLNNNRNALHIRKKRTINIRNDEEYWDKRILRVNSNRVKKKKLNNVNWYELSGNPYAIPILEKNLDRIIWHALSENPNAIHILENNLDKIIWYFLSSNPNAIHILENNLDKVDWYNLSKNPNAINILENNPDRINWYGLCQNPELFKLDSVAMLKNCREMAEELAAAVWNPKRINSWPENCLDYV